jgi:hypothetical protein
MTPTLFYKGCQTTGLHQPMSGEAKTSSGRPRRRQLVYSGSEILIGDGNRMRILKLIAAVIMPVLITLALIVSHERGPVWAQLPPSNPNLGPAVVPSAPPRLSQPAATIGIPPLAPIPTPIAASPTPVARVFHCSCFGRGTGTHFVGNVNAASYFAARQSAISSCLAFNQLKEPVSPFIPPRASLGLPVTSTTAGLPGASLPADAAAVQTLPGTLNFSTAEQLQMCSQCTCD